MARYYLSPHRVARYYFHECDRYLRYTATPWKIKEEEGVPKIEGQDSPLTDAILRTGYSWEEEILGSYLADGDAVVAEAPADNPDLPITERNHSPEATLDALRDARPGQFIYQPTLVATEGFYEKYGLDRNLIEFTECRPDLLMIREVPAENIPPTSERRPTAGPPSSNSQDSPALEIVVIDAKATEELRLNHRIQAALYSLILDNILEDHGLTNLRVARQGGVWLHEQPAPELFDLSGTRPPLETFLSRELTPILKAPAADAFWHLYYRCEWCDFQQHCRADADNKDDVSLVPYLSTFAKRHLAEKGVHTVKALNAFLKRKDADEQLQGIASLRGKRRRLQLSLDAIAGGEEKATGAASAAMPKSEDIRIVLTIQGEPLSGHIYGYAISRFGSGPPKKGSDPHIFDGWNETITRVAPTSGEQDIGDLRRGLVSDLIAILKPVHDFNQAHPSDNEWRIRKSVQAYVFDSYERELLVKALLEAAQDENGRIAEAAMALFFHFQHPDLSAAEDHPADEVFFPVVVLTQVIRNAFALPIKVIYRFDKVVASLAPSKYAFNYQHNDYFDFELSNRIKSDAIFYVWFKQRPDLIANIEGHLKRRVWAAGSVINGIRERLSPAGSLFKYPPKFSLPAGLGFNHPMLSRLAFVSRYEYVLKYLDQRGRRAAPEPERLAANDSLRLTFVGDDRFRLDASQPEIEIEANRFLNWILTQDNESGRRARLAYDDATYREAQWAPKHLDISLASITQGLYKGLIRLDLKESKEFTQLEPGDTVILEKRASDLMTSKLVTELAKLDDEQDPWFVKLVEDPVAARQPLAVPPAVRKTATDLARGSGMTASQLKAFGGMVDNNLQLVWGPPGTGKTHFLAAAILCMAEAHRKAQLPFRVLVTAFTNAAIDNALAKLSELSSAGLFKGGLPTRKLSIGESAVAPALKPKEAAAFATSEPICVLGATVWQVCKVDPGDLSYQLVVVDEGSQLEVAEASIPVRRIAPGGRLVIAGDDRQLPPIVQGAYRIPAGEPLLHRSILECLRDRDPGNVTVATLLENFRMCDVLCKYPAASIYPPTYRPATPEIGARRLRLEGHRSDGFLGQVLDPQYPLVVCVMEDIQATAENLKEASLVAAVALRLREAMPDDTDEEFWSKRLFVVSPHHAQINAIKRELRKRRDWDAEPFVDTVDKMQGQECDVVLVSYGVADVEFALSEKEFIYSLNRLNVAITRARMKTVVVLSRSLLEPPIQALDRNDVAEGIAYMQGLAQICEDANEPVTAKVAGSSVTLLRM